MKHRFFISTFVLTTILLVACNPPSSDKDKKKAAKTKLLETGTIVAGLQSGKVVIGLKAKASDESEIEEYQIQYRVNDQDDGAGTWGAWTAASGKKFQTGLVLTDVTADIVEINGANTFPTGATQKAKYEYRLQSVVKAANTATSKAAESAAVTAVEYGLSYAAANDVKGKFVTMASGGFITTVAEIGSSDSLNATLTANSVATADMYDWELNKGTADATDFEVSDAGQVTATGTSVSAIAVGADYKVVATPKAASASGSIEALVGGTLEYNFEVFAPSTITYNTTTTSFDSNELKKDVNLTTNDDVVPFSPSDASNYEWTIAGSGVVTTSGTAEAGKLDILVNTGQVTGDGSSTNFTSGDYTISAEAKTQSIDTAGKAKAFAGGDLIDATLTVKT